MRGSRPTQGESTRGNARHPNQQITGQEARDWAVAHYLDHYKYVLAKHRAAAAAEEEGDDDDDDGGPAAPAV